MTYQTDRGVWSLVVDSSAQKWIDVSPYGHPIDGQFTTLETVCIDHDATALDIPGHEGAGPQTTLYYGSAECLDEPDWVFWYDSYILFHVYNLKVKNKLIITTFSQFNISSRLN